MTSGVAQNVLYDFFNTNNNGISSGYNISQSHLSHTENMLLNNNNSLLDYNVDKETYKEYMIIEQEGNKENDMMVYKPIVPKNEMEYGDLDSECNLCGNTKYNEGNLPLYDVNYSCELHFSTSSNSTNDSDINNSNSSSSYGSKNGKSNYNNNNHRSVVYRNQTAGTTAWSSRKRNNHRTYHSSICKRAYGLTLKLRSRFEFLKINYPNPIDLLNYNQWNRLNQAVWELYNTRVQRLDTYGRKVELWKKMYLFMNHTFPYYALYMVGSTMTGFGTDDSDVDMCFLIKPVNKDVRIDSLHRLTDIKNLLIKYNFTTEAELISARVPILKFTAELEGFEVDLNCNNAIGIHNTHMLSQYSRIDWRVRPLVIVIKLWAQLNGINDAKNMTVSSYSWTLMVLNYLQYGVNPPIVPCLHMLYPHKFNLNLHPSMLEENLDQGWGFRSQNTCCLAELLLGFFEYYSVFDYDHCAVSVRVGGVLPIDQCRNRKSPKNDPFQWKYLCIEEPFDHTNTARSVYDAAAFKHIKNVINSSYEQLLKTNLLSKILPVAVNTTISGNNNVDNNSLII